MNNLQDRIESITEILTLPDIVLKINNLIANPDTSASDISNIISTDLALSTKMLKLVNSPFYGFSKQITSINYAIVILGFNAVRNLAMTVFVMDLKNTDNGNFDTKKFWEFSINCGVVSNFLASAAKLEVKDDAFLAGLVHDIGVIILNQYFQEEFNMTFNYATENNCTLLDAEKKLLDFTHIDVGRLILESWNLPERIINVCKFFTNPSETSEVLPSLVHFSDIICRGLALGNPADNCIPALDQYAIEKIGVDSSAFYPILAQVLEKTSSTKDLL